MSFPECRQRGKEAGPHSFPEGPRSPKALGSSCSPRPHLWQRVREHLAVAGREGHGAQLRTQLRTDMQESKRKNSFPRGGKERPRLLGADRSDQRTRMTWRWERGRTGRLVRLGWGATVERSGLQVTQI
jgi:hypothetical protein